MRSKVTKALPETTLARILDSLDQELVDATDDELRAVAEELGMDLARKDSAAYAGVTYPEKPQLSDFFDLDVYGRLPPPDKE